MLCESRLMAINEIILFLIEENDMNDSDPLDSFLDGNEMWNFEGEAGIDNLNSLTETLGYKSNGFKYGSSLEQFLMDNGGAQEAIVEWIGNQIDKNEEWQTAITYDELEDE